MSWHDLYRSHHGVPGLMEALSRFAESAGAGLALPQWGHFTFLPASSFLTFSVLPQAPHWKEVKAAALAGAMRPLSGAAFVSASLASATFDRPLKTPRRWSTHANPPASNATAAPAPPRIKPIGVVA